MTLAKAVTLGLSASDGVGVTGYYLSTSATVPSATAAGWVAVGATRSYTGSVAYTLSSGDGAKVVYAWYKDAARNVSKANSALTCSQRVCGKCCVSYANPECYAIVRAIL